MITQVVLPKLCVHYWFQSFPIAFIGFSLLIYCCVFPFLCLDLYLSFMVVLLLSGLSVLMLFLLSYTGLSKYSIIGCIRVISQYVAYELALTTLLLCLVYSYNDLNLSNYYVYLFGFNLNSVELMQEDLLIIAYILLWNYFLVVIWVNI